MTKRKQKETEQSLSVFRYMCLRTDDRNYHIDFTNKEEAFQYIEKEEKKSSLKLVWHGVYEIMQNKDSLSLLVSKRFHVKEIVTVDNKVETKRRQRKAKSKE